MPDFWPLTHLRYPSWLKTYHELTFCFCFLALQRSNDAPVLLTKNEIKAVKKLVFTVVRKALKIGRIKEAEFEAYDVDLHAVLVWAIREQRLHSADSEEMEFNIKLDGRPLGGLKLWKLSKIALFSLTV